MIPHTKKKSPLEFNKFDSISIEFDRMQRDEIILYLKGSHQSYKRTVIPQIEQSFLGILKLFPNEPSLSVIFNLFLKFQISFELHMRIEESTIYLNETDKNATRNDNMDHTHEEPFLTEIISSLNRQIYSKNPFCQILISQLMNFNDELKQHCWIEENLI